MPTLENEHNPKAKTDLDLASQYSARRLKYALNKNSSGTSPVTPETDSSGRSKSPESLTEKPRRSSKHKRSTTSDGRKRPSVKISETPPLKGTRYISESNSDDLIENNTPRRTQRSKSDVNLRRALKKSRPDQTIFEVNDDLDQDDYNNNNNDNTSDNDSEENDSITTNNAILFIKQEDILDSIMNVDIRLGNFLNLIIITQI